ncbi:linker for activation of T-cells family member 1 isoform X1 [Pungitius pungitius]|uniref:linker for activation of T-cells family member 1 isoform X1 n=1 Tax=Pungitius pungitius TaxID=134920 RepID=UPI002E154D98
MVLLPGCVTMATIVTFSRFRFGKKRRRAHLQTVILVHPGSCGLMWTHVVSCCPPQVKTWLTRGSCGFWWPPLWSPRWCWRGSACDAAEALRSASAKPTPQRTTCPQTNPDLTSEHLSSNLLSPHFTSADSQNHRRQQSFTPTETESNPSYENPADADGPDYINAESDADDAGYILVLPEEQTGRTNGSRASTPSSDVQHDYENVPEKKFEVEVEDDEDDDDEDEGNYVNVQDGLQPSDGAQRPSSSSSSED